MLLDVPFLPVLICFFVTSLYKTVIPAVWIKEEYKSGSPKDVAGAASTSATVGGRSVLQIRPTQ